MRKPKPQSLQSTNPKDYKVRIVVFGTRHYENRREFHEELMDYIEQFGEEPILFLSGAAKSGADNLIIRWCLKFGYPFKPYPADWDRYDKGAGFIRNTEMAQDATHGLGFWDGSSNGTNDMKEKLSLVEAEFRIVKVEIPKDNDI